MTWKPYDDDSFIDARSYLVLSETLFDMERLGEALPDPDGASLHSLVSFTCSQLVGSVVFSSRLFFQICIGSMIDLLILRPH